jgi:hypothetical protein
MRTARTLAAALSVVALSVVALAGCGTATTTAHPAASPSAGKTVVPVAKPSASAATSAAIVTADGYRLTWTEPTAVEFSASANWPPRTPPRS